MLRTIVFDLGNVLVYFCHERMCRQLGQVLQRSAAETRSWLMDSGLQWRVERGWCSDEEFVAEAERFAGQALERDALATAASDIFTLNEPMVPLIEELKARGHRLVLLSNTTSWHFDWVWQQYSILQRFDELVLSYRVGAIKPDPAIFDALLATLACPADEAFYTDDIPQYVTAGRRHGLQAEVFHDAARCRDELRSRGVLVGGG